MPKSAHISSSPISSESGPISAEPPPHYHTTAPADYHSPHNIPPHSSQAYAHPPPSPAQ
ncbi:MAG: hypothetical protein U1U88_001258 [Lawsonella clevelandensis]